LLRIKLYKVEIMSNNPIQKFMFEDKIRFYYFRYRGVISKIVSGLKKLPEYKNTTIDPSYVAKVIKKFEKERKNNLGLHVCWNFMEFLHMGVQERLSRYQQWMEELEPKSEVMVSSCHRVPVGEILVTADIDGGWRCLEPGCNKRTVPILLENVDVYNLRMRLLEEMRKDEGLLLKAIKDLGFTASEPPQVNKVTQYNFHQHNDSPKSNQQLPKELNTEDTKLLTDISELDPRARESMIKRLEKNIVVDSEFEDKDETSKQK
jgi:hypothetical protein